VPVAEPDQSFSYSNTNYILLGQLLEAIGGSDLESALQSRIVEPLGLEATTFDVDGSRMPDTLGSAWAGGVFQGDPTAAYESIASSAWSAGALVSTTADLATFLAALFEGELISDGLLAEMLDSGPEGYGLGIASTGLWLGGVGSDSFYGHSGRITGYVSVMAGDPESGDMVILLSNNEALDPHEPAAEIIRAWETSEDRSSVASHNRRIVASPGIRSPCHGLVERSPGAGLCRWAAGQPRSTSGFTSPTRRSNVSWSKGAISSIVKPWKPASTKAASRSAMVSTVPAQKLAPAVAGSRLLAASWRPRTARASASRSRITMTQL
jgi:hypothetical protein